MSSNPPLTFARVNGHNLHYARTQPPSGGDGADGQETPTLVFINSLGTDFRIWNTVIEAFADTWPTLAYDKRGHGLSDAGTYPYSMDDHVEDLLGLLDHLSIDRIVLVGVSVGG